MHDKLLSSKKHQQEFKYIQYYYNSGSFSSMYLIRADGMH